MSDEGVARGASFKARVAVDTRTSDRSGSGPLVVLMYGLGSSPGIWRGTCEHLGLSYVVLEYAGFGYDRDPADYGTRIEDSARDVARSGILGDQKLILVGHSLGVVMAMAIAAELPEDQTLEIIGVNGLLDWISEILMRPVVGALHHPRVWFRWQVLKVGLTKALPKFLTERLRRPGLLFNLMCWPMAWKPWRLTDRDRAFLLDGNRAPGVLEFERVNQRHDFAAQARGVRWPMLFLEGDHDPLTTPPRRSQFLAWLQVPYAVEIVPGTGHLLPLEAPKVIAEAITRHLAAAR